eukprot:GABV01001201.1.p1 GENE.GABV01001201.1~~GABV01001201.1.p1  ORF type:complete len:164 (-),score=26.45 GABV01001201.1:224-715(-)
MVREVFKFRISNVYKFVSSLATVKLNASVGLHAMQFVFMRKITFLNGVFARASYKTILRSVAADTNKSLSIGFQRTHEIESAPHENECTGSASVTPPPLVTARAGSHNSTASPPVATNCAPPGPLPACPPSPALAPVFCASIDVNGAVPTKVAKGSTLGTFFH